MELKSGIFSTAAYVGESPETFDLWVSNMNEALNALSYKYPNSVGEIILYVNGGDCDNLSLRSRISSLIKSATANNNMDIRLEFTQTPGKPNAISRVYQYARDQGRPILMTDLDVLRLSDSITKLSDQDTLFFHMNIPI